MKRKNKIGYVKSGIIVFFLIFILTEITQAATYYVRTNGNNSNNGLTDSAGGAWRTIDSAASNVSAGDTVYVHAGTYDERVTCDASGNSELGYINFVGYPGDSKPVMRGFNVTNKSYIRIIGFEITHNSTSYTYGIDLGGICSYIEILDNYFHHTNGNQVRWYNRDHSHITIRGNEFYMSNCPSGIEGACKGGSAVSMVGGNHILVEYNELHRVGDFINIKANRIIVRNNYMYDFANFYFPDGYGDSSHVDMFQPAGSTHNSQYQVYEANFMGDNVEANSHVLQMRGGTPYSSDDHDILFRFNIAYNHGSYAMQSGGVDYVRYINNTIVNMNVKNPNGYGFVWNEEVGDASEKNSFFNNILYDVTNRVDSPFFIGGASTVTKSNNLCYSSGTDASCESLSDPHFVNYSAKDYYIQSDSPARNTGKAITTVTSADGSGTKFDVVDAGFFIDGYGIADGDKIKVGSNTPVRITNISGNTITVGSPVSWLRNDGVYYRGQDTTPDIGAYEYRSGGYSFTTNITVSGNISGIFNIMAETTNDDVVRQVIFYIDGIPVSVDYENPWSYSWDTSGLAEGSSHTIEARAYALYSTPNMMSSDKVLVVIGNGGDDGVVPSAPTNFRFE